ncbi:hypothetical protein [Deinococcus sp. RM]|uniref:hypothetical protein n=1 Tax=Deinococcus sp. RM TaxID=2316359 RepID=UPI0018F38A61|nr:hypothetical protein [Deinococcus sp. RM]
MHWSIFPIGLFGLLNLFLAVVAPSQARGAGSASFVFVLAAAAILLGLWRGQPPMVAFGCLLGLICPVWMGLLMSGNVNWLHIAVRLVIVVLLFGLWLKFRPV